jgi:hypothetical protein
MPSISENQFWNRIKDGLHLFGIDEQDVTEIAGIPINDWACKLGCKAIGSRVRPNALVFVVGDAALSVHVWPGRGLNSGLKTAIACADMIASVAHKEHVVHLRPSAFSRYTDYLNQLEIREHEGRSLFVVNQSGDPEILLKKLNFEPALIPDASAKFIQEVCSMAKRMEERRDWTHELVSDLQNIIRGKLDLLSNMTVQDMVATGPWPIDKMTGPEVYPILDSQPIGRNSAVCCVRNNHVASSSIMEKTLEAGIPHDMNNIPLVDVAQNKVRIEQGDGKSVYRRNQVSITC